MIKKKIMAGVKTRKVDSDVYKLARFLEENAEVSYSFKSPGDSPDSIPKVMGFRSDIDRKSVIADIATRAEDYRIALEKASGFEERRNVLLLDLSLLRKQPRSILSRILWRYYIHLFVDVVVLPFEGSRDKGVCDTFLKVSYSLDEKSAIAFYNMLEETGRDLEPENLALELSLAVRVPLEENTFYISRDFIEPFCGKNSLEVLTSLKENLSVG